MLKNKTIHRYNYLIFALILTIFSLFILQDFVFGMICGALLALSVWPIFEWICDKDIKFLKGSVSDSALLLTFLTTLLIVLPAGYGIYEAYNLYSLGDTYVSSTISTSAVPVFLYKLPFSEKIVPIWTNYISSSASVVEVLNKATNGKWLTIFSYVWSNIIEKTITIIVMLITFFLMLKHGEFIKLKYKEVFSYWIGEESISHIDCGIKAFRATMNGVVFVGIVEGILLSIPMVLGGFSSGFLIAIIAGLLGVIPMLLPLIVAPCFAYMYYNGAEAWAIIGFIDLALVWIIFENFVKPQVIGKTVKINTFLILISMIGGMQLLGILGLLIGPAVVSISVAVLRDIILVKQQESS